MNTAEFPIAPQVSAYLQRPKLMLIDGKWVGAISGKTFKVEDPATGRVLATVPAGDKADIDAAVRAARRTFDSGVWRNMPPAARAEILWRLSDLLLANSDELATIDTLDNGMPLSFARIIVKSAATSVRYFAGMCTKIYGRTANLSVANGEYHAYTLREPVGVAGLITPWNGPMVSACNKMTFALAAGCSVVLKPAEQTPLSALRLGELALEAGVPPGVVNIVTGLGESAGAALSGHPDVNKVSFTGSTQVGKLIIQASAGNLKRLSLELGGKSPVFVFDDADLHTAIPAVATGIFANSGQICFAGSRLYVQKQSFDKVVAGICDIAKKIRLGNGLDPSTELGPLVSEEQRQRVMAYIESGTAQGAQVVAGGREPTRPGYFVEPTVFVNTKPDMRIVKEEIFGPVLVVAPFQDFDEIAALGNATTYGLGAGIYTGSLSTAHRAAKVLQTGNVWINCYGVTDKTMPYGGYKESGWGREGSYEAVDAFLEHKAVYARL